MSTGGSNVQMGIDPEDGEMMIIEMNPRVSRSSALASKATGFPIAKIAAKLAVGLTLDQIPNDITLKTPASFEPSIDYIVTKVCPGFCLIGCTMQTCGCADNNVSVRLQVDTIERNELVCNAPITVRELGSHHRAVSFQHVVVL